MFVHAALAARREAREQRESNARRAKSIEEWFSQGRVAFAKKKSRTQMQWVLQLSGDFHPSEETAVPNPEPHLMRVPVLLRFATEVFFRLL